jgi:hypothetical protein
MANTSISTASTPVGDNVSEIQSLTSRVHDLERAVNISNSWYVGFVFLAVIVAAAVFLTQFLAIRKARELDAARSQLMAAKDAAVAIDLKDKDLKIEEARKGAATADERAGLANERVAVQESANLRLRTDLEKAITESREKAAELEVEQRKTAEAQREATVAQLALQQHVEEVSKRQAWRMVRNPDKFLGYLKGVAKRQVTLLYNPSDTEAYNFADQIRHWLGPGFKGEGAGWEVAGPLPIPPTGGDERLANAPPQIRYGSMTGAGITFVVNKEPKRDSEDFAVLQALMNAIGFSIGLPAVPIARRTPRCQKEQLSW